MVSASSVSEKKFSKKSFLSSDPNELGDRKKLSIQEKLAENKFIIIDEEIITVADNLLKYKCISTKEQKFFLLVCMN